MEIHNTHAPKIHPEKRYVVALAFNNGRILDVVLRGQLVEGIRNCLQISPDNRGGSVFLENDGHDYFIPTSSIAYMIVSKTKITGD